MFYLEALARLLTLDSETGGKEGRLFTFYLIQFFLFCGTGAWTQGLHLEPLHQPYFYEGFFEVGSLELFAQADFKPQSA
jgi:hypothetical protein